MDSPEYQTVSFRLTRIKPGKILFGRFELKRLLGQGGMGIVWLGRDLSLDQDVALKFLPELLTGDPLAIEDLKKETKRSLVLTHPNIVRIFDFLQDDDSSAISMEFVEGSSLAHLLREEARGCFSVTQIIPWVGHLCEALDYAHFRAKIVHRDLKPANMMISREGELKVADFGTARSITESYTRATRGLAKTTVGTLAYMSPQQAQGEMPTASDDIYALGVCLYELLTGKPPFHTGNIQHQLETAEAPPLMIRRKELGHTGEEIPEQWQDTILACLDKESINRPSSAGEVAMHLGIPLRGGSSSTTVAAPPKPKKKKTGKGLMLASGLLLLATGGAMVWMLQDSSKKTGETPTAETPAAESSPTNTPALPPAHDVATTPGESALPSATITSAETEHESLSPTRHATEQGNPLQATEWVNSLGVKMLKVGLKNVLFSTYETRIRDFERFVDETGYDALSGSSAQKDTEEGSNLNWKAPGFLQAPDHPVCCMSWEDATAFCKWMTQRERKAGKISDQYEYRLPTDIEWSVAAGLPTETGRTPESRHLKIKSYFVWGSEWPPPPNVGNYSDRKKVDPYDYSSPVGQTQPNIHGLYDMGGNVWEWCLDPWNSKTQSRVLRGASWQSYPTEDLLAISYRDLNHPWIRRPTYGFRIVLSAVKQAIY